MPDAAVAIQRNTGRALVKSKQTRSDQGSGTRKAINQTPLILRKAFKVKVKK